MRIPFGSDSRPKKAAKSLSDVLCRPLSLCQTAVAEACGYRDWHELANTASHNNLSSVVSSEERVTQHIDVILRLSNRLTAPDGDVQYALAQTRLLGGERSPLAEQLDIRAGCFRRTSLPNSGRRERGSVGTLKTGGRNGEKGILRSFGRPTSVISHKSADTIVADFEFVAPRDPPPLFIPMRLYLVYGQWTEHDGSIVLFSRDYLPLWRIRSGGTPERADVLEWVRFKHEIWFWTDANTPWRDAQRAREEHQRLDDFGIVGLPALVDVLPLLVLSERALRPAEAARITNRKNDAPNAA